MKTITIHAAKDLRIEECAEPCVGPNQVLVSLETGGICGSDLHYYNHGGFGTVRLKEPMILGHEVAGRVIAIGDGVDCLEEGQLVAVSPSRSCGTCGFCSEGQQNHCMNMRFYGSAMPFPHIQGAFRERLVVDAHMCVPADGLSAGEAAMAEPLSVVLHAAKRAGDLAGKRVLVTGCGPIGLLAVIVARASGAVEIVATDIADFPLQTARQIGADAAINVDINANALSGYATGKGHFDVMFECSGAASALTHAIPAIRPSGTIMQLGLGGDMTLPMQAITAKELSVCGSFRFHHEFPLAVKLMQAGRISTTPLISRQIPLEDAVDAFELASDRSQSLKVQINFAK